MKFINNILIIALGVITYNSHATDEGKMATKSQVPNQVSETLRCVKNMKPKVSQIEQDTSTIINTTEKILTKVCNIETIVGNLSASDCETSLLDPIHTKVCNIESLVENLNISVTDCDTSLLDPIYTKICAIESLVENLNISATDCDTSLLDPIYTKVCVIESLVENLNISATDCDTSLLDPIHTKVCNIESIVETLGGDSSQIEVIVDKVCDIESASDYQGSKIDIIVDKTCDMQSKIDTINNRTVIIESLVENISISATDCDTSLLDPIHTKVCNIESIVETLGGDSSQIEVIVDKVCDIQSASDHQGSKIDIIVDKTCNIESLVENISVSATDCDTSLLDPIHTKVCNIESIVETLGGDSSQIEVIVDKVCDIQSASDHQGSKIDIIVDKTCNIESLVENLSISATDCDTSLLDPIHTKVCNIESIVETLGGDSSQIEVIVDKVCDIQSASDHQGSKIEVIIDKVCDIESASDYQGSQLDIIVDKTCNIQSLVDNNQESFFEVLENNLSILSELLCSKIDDITCISTMDVVTSSIDILKEVLCSKIDGLDTSLLDPIHTKVCNIESIVENLGEDTSKIDVILDKSCDILSIVDGLDDDLQSSTDILCNKSILTQSAVEALASGQGFVSTFGESIQTPLEDMLNVQFQYGIIDAAVTTTLSEIGGSATTISSMATISTDGVDGGFARIQTTRNLRYRPGHEGYAFFTGLFTDGVSTSSQWIGLFDNNNGAAVGYKDTEFSILFRRDGDADTIIPQSSFNLDKLNGTGSSGFTINTNTLNVFRISYGWLGAAPIKFQVMRQDGVWITFHRINRPNTESGPSFLNPVLPIRAEVSNEGGTTELTLQTASWNAGIAGSPSTAGHRFFSKGVLPSATIPDDETHMLTIRNKEIYQSKENKVEIRITSLGGGPTKTGSDAMVLRLRKNAIITGTSFSDINTSSSVIEFSETGTFTADSGEEIFLLPSNSTGGPATLFFPQDSFSIFLLPGETMTVTGISIPMSGTADAIASISWEERF